MATTCETTPPGDSHTTDFAPKTQKSTSVSANRCDLEQTMPLKITVSCSVQHDLDPVAFVRNFVPSNEPYTPPGPLRLDVPTGNESEMYTTLIAALDHIVNPFPVELRPTFVQTSTKLFASLVNSEHSTKPGITIPLPSRGAPANAEIWQWSRVASVIEVKANLSQDPFDKDACKTTQDSDETFAQLAKHGLSLLMGNFSCFCFVLGVYGHMARIYRFDHGGMIVSKAFDYVSHPHVLGEFFWRFFHPIDSIDVVGLSPTFAPLLATNTQRVALGSDLLSSPKMATQSRGVQTLDTLPNSEEISSEFLGIPIETRRRNLRNRKNRPKPPPIGMELEISHGELLYECAFQKAFKLKSGRVVKCGGLLLPEEVETMKFVAQRTTIPIPASAEFICENGRRYIPMNFVDGVPLGSIWATLEDESKTRILAELKGYINQLRALEGSYIGSLSGNLCRDRRVVGWPCGPFESERIFNDHIAANLAFTLSPERVRFLRNMLRDCHKVVFTHADLHPNNILVKDGRVVAILDWEMSGWYLEYWEYSKALWTLRHDSDWENHLGEWLEPYPYEYAVDEILMVNSYGVW